MLPAIWWACEQIDAMDKYVYSYKITMTSFKLDPGFQPADPGFVPRWQYHIDVCLKKIIHK